MDDIVEFFIYCVAIMLAVMLAEVVAEVLFFAFIFFGAIALLLCALDGVGRAINKSHITRNGWKFTFRYGY